MLFLACAILISNIVIIFLVFWKNFSKNYDENFFSINSKLENLLSAIREELRSIRLENANGAKNNREELNSNFKNLSDSISVNIANLSNMQKSQFELFSSNLHKFSDLQRQNFADLIAKNEKLKNESEIRLDKIRETVENKLQILQEKNAAKLEEMRLTVDEKLHATVEKRFTESFKLISSQLEQVYKGLGEMQNLALNVGDLKKVLSNVKTRGVFGEIQLGTILEQFLSPKQYEKNACVKLRTQERVEYVIKLPNKNDDGEYLLLPIDSKFPNEDYQRLIEIYEKPGDIDVKQLEIVNRQFENAVKKNAKDICEKYINPPLTTDFALMFVPTEGLYSEIVKRGDLLDSLQRDHKIIVVGPTNLVAFVSALQIGFKTLNVEKRASEIWKTLGIIKNQFNKFDEVLGKAKKKLNEVINVIDDAELRSRKITKELRNVEEVPSEATPEMLVEIEENQE